MKTKRRVRSRRTFTEQQIYEAALEVARDEALNAEMAEWERAAVSDGLEDLPPWTPEPQAGSPK